MPTLSLPRWLAIVAYRCEIAGKPSDSIDIQVRYLEAQSVEDIESKIKAEPLHSYENHIGELVSWPLIGVLAADTFTHKPDGSEVVGVIAECQEFVKWAAGVAENRA